MTSILSLTFERAFGTQNKSTRDNFSGCLQPRKGSRKSHSFPPLETAKTWKSTALLLVTSLPRRRRKPVKDLEAKEADPLYMKRPRNVAVRRRSSTREVVQRQTASPCTSLSALLIMTANESEFLSSGRTTLTQTIVGNNYIRFIQTLNPTSVLCGSNCWVASPQRNRPLPVDT